VKGLIWRAWTNLRTAATREEGQGVTEYALILILVGVAAILMLGVLGHQVSNNYSNVANGLPH
jgi:pilus assembly protein Flp/PilA